MTLFCYGSGSGPEPPGLPLVRIPRALTPRRGRAGPSPGKPLADAALAVTLVRAQRDRPSTSRSRTHGEAALVALGVRAATGLRLGMSRTPCSASSSRAHARGLAAGAGPRREPARPDARGARRRRARAQRRGGQAARTRGARTARRDPARPGSRASACSRAGGARLRALWPDARSLRALRRQPRLLSGARRAGGGGTPVSAAARGGGDAAGEGGRAVSAARASARRIRGGAPARFRRGGGGAPAPDPGRLPISCSTTWRRAARSWRTPAWRRPRARPRGLDAPAGAGAAELAYAISLLAHDPAHASRLGRAARAALTDRFAWPPLAERTLALCRAVLARGDRP